MSKDADFIMKLGPEQRAEFIERQRKAREYDAYLRQKVESARVSMYANQRRMNVEVEDEFAARRAGAILPNRKRSHT
jgi:hypothetical protein